jgi:DNA-binding CsgD family transcriptional regulator
LRNRCSYNLRIMKKKEKEQEKLIEALRNENAELKEDLNFHRRIIDEIPVMIHINEIVEDKNYVLKWVNKFYENSVTKSVKERNKDTGEYYKQHYNNKDVKTVEDSILALKDDKKIYSAVYNYTPEAGESKWMYSIGVPYKFTKEGELLQILCASIDLADKVYNPERYADMQKELKRIKHELTIATLSKSEIEVLRTLAKGMSEKEIADYQIKSIHTIKTHLKNIRKKLNITKNTKLVKFAIEIGIV